MQFFIPNLVEALIEVVGFMVIKPNYKMNEFLREKFLLILFFIFVKVQKFIAKIFNTSIVKVGGSV
jgi:hypothetical protein